MLCECCSARKRTNRPGNTSNYPKQVIGVSFSLSYSTVSRCHCSRDLRTRRMLSWESFMGLPVFERQRYPLSPTANTTALFGRLFIKANEFSIGLNIIGKTSTYVILYDSTRQCAFIYSYNYRYSFIIIFGLHLYQSTPT